MKKLFSLRSFPSNKARSYEKAPSGPVESETFLTNDLPVPATVVIDGTEINPSKFPDSARKLARIAEIQRNQPESEIITATYTGDRLPGLRKYLGIKDPNPYGREDGILLPLRPAVPGEQQRFYQRGAEERQLWRAVSSDMNLNIYRKTAEKGAAQRLDDMTADSANLPQLIIDGQSVSLNKERARGAYNKLEELANLQQKESKTTDAIPHPDRVEYAAGVNRLLGFRKGAAPDAFEDAMIVDYRPCPPDRRQVILRGEGEKELIRSIQTLFVLPEMNKTRQETRTSEQIHAGCHRARYRDTLTSVPETEEAQSSRPSSFAERERERKGKGVQGRSV